jgi:hypothetical protein
MTTIICPKCGAENTIDAMTCTSCSVNLALALEHLDEMKFAQEHPDKFEYKETIQRERSAATATSKASNTSFARTLIILTTLLGCLGLPVLLNIQENSWHRVSSLPGRALRVEPAPQSQCGTFSFTPPPIPSKAIATYEVCASSVDGASFTKYIVLNDGSIWEWQASVDMMGDFRQTMGIAFRMASGAVIGFLAGSVIVLATKVYRQVKSQRSKRQLKLEDISKQR